MLLKDIGKMKLLLLVLAVATTTVYGKKRLFSYFVNLSPKYVLIYLYIYVYNLFATLG